MRFQPSKRFTKKFRKADQSLQKKIRKALVKLQNDPNSTGVNLEKIRGRTNFYSARIDLAQRFLLRKRRDADGVYWQVVDFGSHDETYR